MATVWRTYPCICGMTCQICKDNSASSPPRRSFVLYPGDERYPKGEGVEVIGLSELASLLAAA